MCREEFETINVPTLSSHLEKVQHWEMMGSDNGILE
jgi:hypothetical protein